MRIQPACNLPAEFQNAYSGKVEDLCRTPANKLLFVATDRISAFNQVMPTPIPDKEKVLTGPGTDGLEFITSVMHSLLGANK